MGEHTKIEWCDMTWNPWIGCQKVSPGCDHCYAEAMAKRYGWVEWGAHGARKRTSEANWRKPLQWAKATRGTGKRPRVFCASLADWLDNQVPTPWRADLLELIDETPELDWLLLTKRPENYVKLVGHRWPNGAPQNVWIGTTCENQYHFDKRYPLIREIRASVHFISYEPAIGPLVNLWGRPEWLICGGESGPGARMMDPAWARSVRDHCADTGIAFFMKQIMLIRLRPTHTSRSTHAIYPVVSHNVPCHIEGIGRWSP